MMTNFKWTTVVAAVATIFAATIGVIASLTQLFGTFSVPLVITSVLFLISFLCLFLMWKYHREEVRSLATDDPERVVIGPARSSLKESIASLSLNTTISEIDIGGLALRSTFFKRESEYSRWLLHLLRQNKDVRVRIWLLHPKSEIAQMRELAERGHREGLLQKACTESLETLKDIVLTIWNEQRRRRPEVVLVDQVSVTHFVYRVNSEMIVCPYLQHGTGGDAPTFRLHANGAWYDTYKRQFERCFEMHKANLYPPQKDLD